MKKLLTLAGGIVFGFLSHAVAAPVDSPIIVIGASLESGKTPCELGKLNVLGCISVGFGEYLSLGQALTHSPIGNGSVLVEAIGGATTFDRPGYIIPGEVLAEVGWEEHGYTKQLTRALAAVTNPFTGVVSAKYAVIGIANDCLHSNAFSTAPSQSSQCNTSDLEAVIDRYIQAGQQALNAGVTPVYTGYPPRKVAGSTVGIDLPFAQVALGFTFVLSDADYDYLVSRFNSRIQAELPGAIIANAWQDLVHFGDGLHPDRESSRRAAKRVMLSILANKK